MGIMSAGLGLLVYLEIAILLGCFRPESLLFATLGLLAIFVSGYFGAQISFRFVDQQIKRDREEFVLYCCKLSPSLRQNKSRFFDNNKDWLREKLLLKDSLLAIQVL